MARLTSVAGSEVGSFLLPSSACTAGYNGTCPHLTPSITSSSPVICRGGSASCPGGAPDNSRVTLWVNATGHESLVPPVIQVVFVVETTPYDGVYDASAGDPGTGWCGAPCNESNAVPFFVANSGQIATAIASSFGASTSSCTPGSQEVVCFAMVDYFSTVGADHDDGDGSEYNPDVTTFVPAGSFQSAVAGTFQAQVLQGGWVLPDSDLSDNILSSSSITALYGAQRGSGLGWDSSADHVLVLISSTAPRDSNYLVNYAASSSDYPSGMSSGCEPAYFSGQPNCYSWDNGTSSVAGYARANNMAIDVIDPANGVTNASSGDYRHVASAQTDVTTILQAGCDLATATGGSWEGPHGNFTCAASATGTGHGNLTCITGGSCITKGTGTNPARGWSTNTPLGWALTHFNLPAGGRSSNLTASGTSHAPFQFLPAAGLVINATNPGYQVVACSRTASNPPLPGPCNALPLVTGLGPQHNGVGWAWPDNAMYLNDSWAISFNLAANASFPTSKLGQALPLDSCQNQSWWRGCAPYSTTSYSQLDYNASNGAPVSPPPSFPPAWVSVVATVVPLAATASFVSGSATPPDPVQFTGTVSGGQPPYTYLWSFGDGSIGSAALDPSHTYNATGTYPAHFLVTDAGGGRAGAFLNVSVGTVPPLTASAQANPTAGVAPLAVLFSSSAAGGRPPYAWSWSFGDGGSAATQNATHTYSTVGQYAVALTVRDAAGSALTRGLNVSVEPNALTASLLATPSSGTLPLTVVFNGTAAGGTPGYTFLWGLGDGSTGSFARNPVHEYNTTGTFQVDLTVADRAGAWVRVWTNISVSTSRAPLTLSISGSPVNGTPPLPVQFQASPHGGATPYLLSWRFADGSPSATGLSPAHTFQIVGTFIVRAWANDSSVPSLSANATLWITVGAGGGGSSPSVTLSAVPDPVAVGAPLNLSSVASGGTAPYAFAWTNLLPGCPSGSRAATLLCVPTQAGNFYVTVIVTDADGKTVTATTGVVVEAPAPPGPPNGHTIGRILGQDPWIVLTVVALLVLATALIVLFARGRKRKALTAPQEGPLPSPTTAQGSPTSPSP